MPFAAALSTHPITAHAAGEVAGALMEALDGPADLVVVHVTPPHAGALEDVATALRTLLGPRALIGCAAESVAANGQEVEREAAVAAWAGTVGPVTPFDVPPGAATSVALAGVTREPSAVVVIGDPFSFDVDGFLAEAESRFPGIPVVGGLASGALGPGGSRLAADGSVRSAGAVGVALHDGVDVETVVSQGCRPVGDPFVVTAADGNMLLTLGGRTALERIEELAERHLTPQEIDVVNRGGLHVGVVVDEHRDEYGAGDFLVRNVLGADRATGAVAVGETVEVGRTVQFHLRDPRSADLELRTLLSGCRADAALLFTCNGRGTRLFAEPHHDAALLDAALGGVPTAGFFAAGELGPVGGRTYLHGFTASIALLRAR